MSQYLPWQTSILSHYGVKTQMVVLFSLKSRFARPASPPPRLHLRPKSRTELWIFPSSNTWTNVAWWWTRHGVHIVLSEASVWCQRCSRLPVVFFFRLADNSLSQCSGLITVLYAVTAHTCHDWWYNDLWLLRINYHAWTSKRKTTLVLQSKFSLVVHFWVWELNIFEMIIFDFFYLFFFAFPSLCIQAFASICGMSQSSLVWSQWWTNTSHGPHLGQARPGRADWIKPGPTSGPSSTLFLCLTSVPN